MGKTTGSDIFFSVSPSISPPQITSLDVCSGGWPYLGGKGGRVLTFTNM